MFMLSHFLSSFLNHAAQPITPFTDSFFWRLIKIKKLYTIARLSMSRFLFTDRRDDKCSGLNPPAGCDSWRTNIRSPAMVDPPTQIDSACRFSKAQLAVVGRAAALAEELVSDHYKMSASQWLRRRYDIKTRRDLKLEEVVEGPLAQVIRYEGRAPRDPLSSAAFDFFVVCLQDPTILATLAEQRHLDLYPFVLYILTHELIHIVRFSQFLQNFEASESERLEEESRVHGITREILQPMRLPGMDKVINHYSGWQKPFENLSQI